MEQYSSTLSIQQVLLNLDNNIDQALFREQRCINLINFCACIVGSKVDDERRDWHKCWYCSDSSHWPDQCQKLAAMRYDDLVKAAEANHVCFCCLKKAGREHKQANCKRKRQCTKSENGIQCTSFHHPLLHKSNNVIIGVALLSKRHESMLPVITANIFGPRNIQKRVNVLFDSGA